MDLLFSLGPALSRRGRRPARGGIDRHADIQRPIAPIVQAIFPDAIEFLLRGAPQHRYSGERVEQTLACFGDACQDVLRDRGSSYPDLQDGETEPRIGFLESDDQWLPCGLGCAGKDIANRLQDMLDGGSSRRLRHVMELREGSVGILCCLDQRCMMLGVGVQELLLPDKRFRELTLWQAVFLLVEDICP